MVEVLILLVYICVAALLLWIVLYVLTQVGVPIPPMVVKIVWIIFGLLCLIWLLQTLPGLNLPRLPR